MSESGLPSMIDMIKALEPGRRLFLRVLIARLNPRFKFLADFLGEATIVAVRSIII